MPATLRTQGLHAGPQRAGREGTARRPEGRVLKQILAPEALNRPGRVELVKDKVEALEMKLIQMARGRDPEAAERRGHRQYVGGGGPEARRAKCSRAKVRTRQDNDDDQKAVAAAACGATLDDADAKAPPLSRLSAPSHPTSRRERAHQLLQTAVFCVALAIPSTGTCPPLTTPPLHALHARRRAAVRDADAPLADGFIKFKVHLV